MGKISVLSEEFKLFAYYFLRPILIGRHPYPSLKGAVEMGDVIEATLVAALGDAEVGRRQKLLGDGDAEVDKILKDGLARLLLKIGTHRTAIHAHMLGQILQIDLTLIIASEEYLYLLDTTIYPLMYVQMTWAATHHSSPAWHHVALNIGLVILSIGIAWALLKLYDEPVRAWLKKKLFALGK